MFLQKQLKKIPSVLRPYIPLGLGFSPFLYTMLTTDQPVDPNLVAYETVIATVGVGIYYILLCAEGN